MNKESNKNNLDINDITLDVEQQGAKISLSQSSITEDDQADSNILTLKKKLFLFYNAPITKFWQNAIFYIIFLIAFSYIILTKTPQQPSCPEIFVLTYLFTYGIDKLREVLNLSKVFFIQHILLQH